MPENENDALVRKFRVFPRIEHFFLRGFVPKTELGLKDSEYRTMMEIRFHEGRPMCFYSEKIKLEQGSFTYIVDKLESKGVLVRKSDPDDRRKKTLHFTEKGRRITAEVHKQLEEQLHSRLENLTHEQKKALEKAMDILEPVLESMNEENNINE